MTELVRAAEQRRKAYMRREAEALHDRDDAIRAALAAGTAVTDVAAAAGLSRERIYQIAGER